MALALAAPAQAKPLVSFHQTGGIAGVDERLVVKPNRAARITNDGRTERFRIGRERMQRLRDALGGWRTLERNYPTRPRIPDSFHYAITHAGHTVQTDDGAERPRRLTRVLSLLRRIADRR